jgi:GT2 family glycosyltransferase
MPEMRSVTALVVTWDSAADIERCLRSLDLVEHEAFDIVVLDNASDDDTVARVEAIQAAPRRHPLALVRLPENRGFCGAVNIGVRRSDADAVLLVNPDATVEPDTVSRMVQVLVDHPTCGSVQPKVLRLGSDPVVIDTTGHLLTRPRLVLNRGSGEADDGRYETPGEVLGVSGALALHRRTMLEDVAILTGSAREYLAEDLVAYFDDVDLDLRARMRGWTARYEPAAIGHHARAGVSQRRRRRVRVLNLANHPLVIIGNEGVGTLLRDAIVVVPVWLARLVVATLRSPWAIVLAVGRLRLLPTAIRRGREARARAKVPIAEVLERWQQPLPHGWLRAAARRGIR